MQRPSKNKTEQFKEKEFSQWLFCPMENYEMLGNTKKNSVLEWVKSFQEKVLLNQNMLNERFA